MKEFYGKEEAFLKANIDKSDNIKKAMVILKERNYKGISSQCKEERKEKEKERLIEPGDYMKNCFLKGLNPPNIFGKVHEKSNDKNMLETYNEAPIEDKIYFGEAKEKPKKTDSEGESKALQYTYN